MRRRKLNSSFRTPGCPLMIRFSKSVRILIEARGAKRRQRSEIGSQRSKIHDAKSITPRIPNWLWLGRTTLHFNIRAVCDEGRDRLCLERLEEFFAVECGDVSFQFEGIGRPDFPPWMFDAVLAGAFAPPSLSSYGVTSTRGVAPIMFGDELFVRTECGRLRLAVRVHGEMFPFIAAAPLVFHSHNSVSVFHFAAHREGEIRLAVEDAGGDGDGDFGDEFTDENDAASPGVGGFFAHVKAQIYFFEIAMPWNGKAAHNRVIEEEADDAEVGFVVVEIELGAGGHMRGENFRIEGEVERGQVTPVRGRKRLQ